ncbi:glycosyltransferase [Rhodococcus pyridinivorans]
MLVTGARANRELSDNIEDFKPDLIHVQNLWPSWGLGALRAIRNSKIPYVQTLRNYRWTCLSANHFRDGRECFDCSKSATAISGIVHRCYRGSRSESLAVALHDAGLRAERQRGDGKPSLVIALSHAMKDRVEKSVPSSTRVAVKYNSLESDPGFFEGPRDGLIWVGRLEPEKGFDIFLDGWMHSKRPKLTIIGDGTLSHLAEDLVRKSPGMVQWSSICDHESTVAQIGRARLSIILPRWEEPFGRVALESLAVGTPVLHSGRGALREIVSSAGWEVEMEPSQISNAIDTLYSGAQERCQTARTRYLDVFSPQATTETLIAIYNDVLRQST